MDDEFALAVSGDWDALLAALRENRGLAHHRDANGMTLLHWVCLHHDIPTEVLIKIVFANPHAVNERDAAGHLPVDLAVQAECEERILEVLRAADPQRQETPEAEPSPVHSPVVSMARSHTGSSNHFGGVHIGGDHGGAYPIHEDDELPYDSAAQLILADPRNRLHQHRSPTSTSEFALIPHAPGSAANSHPLQSIYAGVPHPGDLHAKAHSTNYDDPFRRHRPHGAAMSVAAEDYYYHHQPHQLDHPHPASDSHVLQAAQAEAHAQAQAAAMATVQPAAKWKGTASVTAMSFPPRWKQSRSCQVCTLPFTFLKRRHHCRNCGASVCGQHSTHRVALPKFALADPQRICDQCFLGGHHLTKTPPPSDQQLEQYYHEAFGLRP